MKRRVDPPAQLYALAQAQAGVVSRAQCLALGLNDEVLRRLTSGTWVREARGVYRLHPPPDRWVGDAWVGVLVGGHWAMLGGWSAAHVLGLTTTRPQPIELWVRRSERSTVRDVRWLFRQDAVGRMSRGSLPVTRVEQTLADCARDATTDQLAALLGKAFSDRLTTPVRVRELVQAQDKLPGRRTLLSLLPDVAAGAFSALEVRFLREVQRAHGLPSGSRQVVVAGFLDVLLEEYGIVIELDGRLGHEGAAAFRDMARDNRHAALGLLTLRFGWFDVATRPCTVARQVAAALATQGWQGTLSPCRRCRAVPAAP